MTAMKPIQIRRREAERENAEEREEKEEDEGEEEERREDRPFWTTTRRMGIGKNRTRRKTRRKHNREYSLFLTIFREEDSGKVLIFFKNIYSSSSNAICLFAPFEKF